MQGPDNPGQASGKTDKVAETLKCWTTNFEFAKKAATMPVGQMASEIFNINAPTVVQKVPITVRSAARLFTNPATIIATATGTTTGGMLVSAWWTNGGWVANLSPGQALLSYGANSVMSFGYGYLAFQGGVRAGASYYATGQTIAGNCQ
jgi:hypothetical protein